MAARRDGIDQSMASLSLSTFFFFPLSCEPSTQRYGYKNAALDAKDKAKLQAEILELIFAHGEYFLGEGRKLDDDSFFSVLSFHFLHHSLARSTSRPRPL